MDTFKIKYIPDLLIDSCYIVDIVRCSEYLPYDKDEIIQLIKIIQDDNPGYIIYVKLGLLFDDSIIWQSLTIHSDESIVLNPYKGESIIYANIFDEIEYIAELNIKIVK